MCCCIVEDQDMIIIRVVLLKDFNCLFCMQNNSLIGIVSILTREREYVCVCIHAGAGAVAQERVCMYVYI